MVVNDASLQMKLLFAEGKEELQKVVSMFMM